MAFYSNEEDEDELQPGVTPNQPLAGGSIVGASSTVQPQKGDSSGSFVGVKNYLDANKTQGAKLGDQAASVINQSSNDARNKVTGLQNKFNQAADAGVVGLDQGALDQASNDASKLNDEQKATVKKQYNAAYGGPQNLTDYSDDYLGAQKAVNTASSNVQNQATEGGRRDLVKQINEAAGKNYRTSGALDNLLLQAGGGKEKLATAANQNKDVVNSLTSAQTAATDKANQAKATTQATKDATRSAIGQVDDPSTPEDESSGAFGGIVNYLKGKATNANDPARYQEALDQAQSAQLNDQLLADYGLDPTNNFYNLDLGGYLIDNPQDASWQDMAASDDAAKYNALAEIAGLQGGLQAGSYKPYSIDQGAVQTGQRNAERDYQDYFNLGGASNNIKDDINLLGNYFAQTSQSPLGSILLGSKNVDDVRQALQYAQANYPAWGNFGQGGAPYNAAIQRLNQYVDPAKQNAFFSTENKRFGRDMAPEIKLPNDLPIFIPPSKDVTPLVPPKKERRS